MNLTRTKVKKSKKERSDKKKKKKDKKLAKQQAKAAKIPPLTIAPLNSDPKSELTHITKDSKFLLKSEKDEKQSISLFQNLQPNAANISRILLSDSTGNCSSEEDIKMRNIRHKSCKYSILDLSGGEDQHGIAFCQVVHFCRFLIAGKANSYFHQRYHHPTFSFFFHPQVTSKIPNLFFAVNPPVTNLSISTTTIKLRQILA